MIVSAHQPHYLPWIGYFNKIYLSDVFMLMDNMTYTNKGYISKNRILTNKGWRYLTVPLVKPFGYQTSINQLKIENESQANWKFKHLRTLKHHYQKGKGFNDFFPLLEAELLKENINYFKFQYNLISLILSYLNIQTKVILGSENDTGGKKENDLILNILKDSNCNKFLLGLGASNTYIDKKKIIKNGYSFFKLEFIHPAYEQCCSDICVYGISIVDLLLCCSQQQSEDLVKNSGQIIPVDFGIK